MTRQLPLVIIADSNSLRYQLFRKELEEWSQRVDTEVCVHLIEWTDVCERQGHVTELIRDTPAMVRVESPARNPAIFQLLMQIGNRALSESVADWSDDRGGWIGSPRRLFLGLQVCLEGLRETLARCPHLQCPSNPDDIIRLFDKNRTAEILKQAGLPIPDQIQPPASAADLLEKIKATGWQTAFVKLAHGSCASGIACVQAQRNQPSALSTVKQIGNRFYNTYDLQHLREDNLNTVLQFVIDEQATVQRGINKTLVDGRNTDFRIIVSGNQILAAIGRSSRHQMTNLHLGGSRCEPEAARRAIPKRRWLDGLDVCVEAASLFQLPYVGIDLAFDQVTAAPCILEINAFGDFFPRWIDFSGKTIHQSQIEKLWDAWNDHAAAN